MKLNSSKSQWLTYFTQVKIMGLTIMRRCRFQQWKRLFVSDNVLCRRSNTLILSVNYDPRACCYSISYTRNKPIKKNSSIYGGYRHKFHLKYHLDDIYRHPWKFWVENVVLMNIHKFMYRIVDTHGQPWKFWFENVVLINIHKFTYHIVDTHGHPWKCSAHQHP